MAGKLHFLSYQLENCMLRTTLEQVNHLTGILGNEEQQPLIWLYGSSFVRLFSLCLEPISNRATLSRKYKNVQFS